MIPLEVIMRFEFSNSVSQCILTKEDHLVQAAFFDAADEAFGLRVQIGDRGGSLTASIPQAAIMLKTPSYTADRDLLSQNSIFFHQIIDDFLLLLVQPT